MYYAAVALFMFLLPLLSIVIDMVANHLPLTVQLTGKWYVFWAVGTRLLVAGLRQAIQPRYTAQQILGIKGDDALVLVRELGFANIAFGVIGTLSMAVNTWVMPAALAGGIFYALAGINHALQKHRNRLEQTAMGSDFFAAVLLVGYSAWAGLGS